MASLVSRLIACLVAVVAVLQLVHLVLLNKLESRRLNEVRHLHGNQLSNALGDVEASGSIINGVGGRRSNIRRDVYSIAYGDGSSTSAVKNALLLADRLHEAYTIVDSGGSYRIVFSIAGPRLSNNGKFKRVTEEAEEKTNNEIGGVQDDFTIDDVDSIHLSSQVDVTLVTQSDLENAKRYLLPLITRWQGPISIAIFASNSSQVDSTLEFIAIAQSCEELIRRYVSFHLVFPFVENVPTQFNTTTTRLVESKRRKKNKSYKKNLSSSSFATTSLPLKSSQSDIGNSESDSGIDDTNAKCQQFFNDASSPSPSGSVNYNGQNYPINLVRNVARKITTQFSFVTDIDMLPSVNLRKLFQKFITRNRDLMKSFSTTGEGSGDEKKVVFVVPAFESKDFEKPGDKKELLRLIENYQVRPFYFDLCWKCQVHTDYEAWQREPASKKEQLSILIETIWKDPWEPYFISDNSVPQFDERFKQYGYNRISQLCELHVAGYKFAILNDAFLIHRGFKTPQSFYADKNRDLEMNRIRFRQFKNELKNKYPHSTRRCY